MKLTKEQEADGDVVEEMGRAVWDDGMDSYASRRVRMTAALAVARVHFAAHPPEGWYTTEQVEKAARAVYLRRGGQWTGDDFVGALEKELARLTTPKQSDPAVEAVREFVGHYPLSPESIVAAVRKADQGERHE